MPAETAHALMNQARIEIETGAFDEAERNAKHSLALTTSRAFESQTSLLEGVACYRRLLHLQGNQKEERRMGRWLTHIQRTGPGQPLSAYARLPCQAKPNS